jgi:hypothetical protein
VTGSPTTLTEISCFPQSLKPDTGFLPQLNQKLFHVCSVLLILHDINTEPEEIQTDSRTESLNEFEISSFSALVSLLSLHTMLGHTYSDKLLPLFYSNGKTLSAIHRAKKLPFLTEHEGAGL